jgi:hypothetical protein
VESSVPDYKGVEMVRHDLNHHTHHHLHFQVADGEEFCLFEFVESVALQSGSRSRTFDFALASLVWSSLLCLHAREDIHSSRIAENCEPAAADSTKIQFVGHGALPSARASR